MGIDHNNIFCMHNLALHCRIIDKNYDLTKKYYLMAIEQGHPESMYKLGWYYNYIEINYDLMEKYYLEKNNMNSLCRLLSYYSNKLMKKLELMIKYMDKIKREKIINHINEIAKVKLDKEDKKKICRYYC
jgi:TPR repeat protein